MGNIGADTGNDPAAPEPLLPEGAETSSDPAALPAVEEAIDLESNESARVAADAPIPEPAIPFHSLAGIFPPREASIREQAQRIGGNVPIDPVILFEGKILDRADLYLACLMIGREPRFETYAGDDPVEFVIGRHRNRGPLSESQRAMAGARAANLHLGDNQYSEGVPIGRASELLNVSSRSIARARFVLRHGTSDLIAAVDYGSITVSAAWRECNRLLRQPFRNGNAPATVTPITQEAGLTAQAETASDEIPGGETESSTSSSTISKPQATDSDVPGITERPDGAETTPEVVVAAEAAIIPTEWVWPEYIPSAGVIAVIGQCTLVPIVAAKLAATITVGGRFPDNHKTDCGNVLWASTSASSQPVRDYVYVARAARAELTSPTWTAVDILGPDSDDFGLPVRHLSAQLRRLTQKLWSAAKVKLIVIDYLSDYLAYGDLERDIERLGPALQGLQAFAVQHRTSVLLPMRLPYRSQPDFNRAIQSLARSSDINSVLVVERDTGSATGTLSKWNGRAERGAPEHRFHVRHKWNVFEEKVPAIEWDSLAALQDELSRRW
jgi:hypothetical protein